MWALVGALALLIALLILTLALVAAAVVIRIARLRVTAGLSLAWTCRIARIVALCLTIFFLLILSLLLITLGLTALLARIPIFICHWDVSISGVVPL